MANKEQTTPDREIQLRPANSEDMLRTFQWSNDPLVREMSFHSQPIHWGKHQAWFKNILRDPTSLLLIAELVEAKNRLPIGQVRLDNGGIVSISIGEDYRGQGIGPQVLNLALEYFKENLPESRELIAYIKPKNEASINLFTRANFEFVEEIIIAGQPCLKFALYVS